MAIAHFVIGAALVAVWGDFGVFASLIAAALHMLVIEVMYVIGVKK